MFKKYRFVTGTSQGGYYYNPSGFCSNGEFYGILRGEDRIINTLDELFTQQCHPYIFSSKEKKITKVNLIGFNLEEDRLEDFRLFKHNGVTLCSFVYINKKSWDETKTCKQGLGCLDFKNKTLTKIKIYDSPCNRTQEKNWGFFSLNNEIFFIYSINPWLVYKLNSKTFEIERVVNYNNFNFYSQINDGNLISISSLPIEYNEEEMICFIHTKEKGVYHQTVLTFNKTSLDITYVCPKIILKGEREKGNKNKKGILYISGLAIDHYCNEMVIYYGEADTSSCMYKINKKEFDKLIKEWNT